MNLITDAAFLRLSWPERHKVLRDLNNLACAQEGRTAGEANKKRAPIERRMQQLQKLHDAQVKEWVSEADGA